MKKTNKFIKRNLTLAALSLGIGMTGQVSAHDLNQSLIGGFFGASATDLSMIQCFSDPGLGGGAAAAKLSLRVRKSQGSSSFLNVTVMKDGVAKSTVIGQTPNVWSPWIQVAPQQGNGNYMMTVSQTHAVNSFYTIEYHCESAGGAHTGTSLVTLQNQ